MNDKNSPSYQSVNLKNQLFLLILTPVMLAAMATSMAAFYLQQQDLREIFLEKGALLNEHYRQEAETLLKQDPNGGKELAVLANRLLNEPGVRATHFYQLNPEGEKQTLDYRGPHMRPVDDTGAGLAVRQRFVSQLELENDSRKVFLETELEGNLLRLRSYESIIFLIGVTLALILLSMVFAHVVSSRFSEPIRGISYAIARIREGQLATRVKSKVNRGELSELINGVNSMAESLQSAHEELQSSVDQATEDLRSTLETIEIQNIELDFARRDAEQASKVKSQFLANISHEIRTPLNSIIGFTNLLLKSSNNEKQRDQLQTILKSSENLLSIINDILDVSKIEAGKLNLDIEEVSIRDILNQVVEILTPLAREKNLKQEIMVEEDVPELILSDPLRIQQILTNLINNAIKFSDQGSLIIKVNLVASNSSEGLLKISVMDQGIGLSEKAKEKLFEAFHQSDTSDIRRYQGTGLGLTISRHLVELLGGEIGVESALGEGSTFWFTLPCTQANAEQKPEKIISEANPDYQRNESGFQIEEPKILAVDDNPANLKLICALLDDLNIDYDACESGHDAIELNKQNEYDLIFMDVQMPNMDGIEATRQIREYDKRFSRHRAIVALTAHALEEEKERCIEFGFNHCLTKPIDTEQLVSTIEHWTGYVYRPESHSENTGQLKADNSVIFDPEEGLRLSGNKEALAEEMLEMLVNSLPGDLEEIEKYFSDNDKKALLDKVHYVHGACRYCGVPNLRAVADRLETDLKRGIDSNLESLVEELKTAISTLLEFYRKREKPIYREAS